MLENFPDKRIVAYLLKIDFCSSISEHIFPSSSPRNDGATKKLRQRDVTTHDAVHFDESMTEDEKIELSKKAVMPSESHRRYRIAKRLNGWIFNLK